MRNPGWAGGALIAVTLALTACGTGSAGGAYGNYGTHQQRRPPAPPPAAARPCRPHPPIRVDRCPEGRDHRAGTVLASSSGLTLYYYRQDKPHSGKSVCTGSCATAWPPLAAPVKPPAGLRLPGPLGMITRPGGVRQVTLNGFPVYPLRRGQGPRPGRRQRHRGLLARHQDPCHRRHARRRTQDRDDPAGRVLASSRGLTLYYYSADKPHSGKSACTATCATAWPPLAAPVKAPPGVRLPRKARRHHPSGRRQAGHPQRLSPLPLRRRQGPRPGRRQRHWGVLARHQDQGLTWSPMRMASIRNTVTLHLVITRS